MAVDRKSIIDNWLEGEGWPATNGFVPRMKGYPSLDVKGHTYDVEKAQALMASAGYPNGRGFPTLSLYVNALEESGGHKLAKAVACSLKENLGVNVNKIGRASCRE